MKKDKIELNEALSTIFSEDLIDSIDNLEIKDEINKAKGIGTLTHDDIHIDELEITIKGIKIGKIRAGKWFTVAVIALFGIATLSWLLATVIMC